MANKKNIKRRTLSDALNQESPETVFDRMGVSVKQPTTPIHSQPFFDTTTGKYMVKKADGTTEEIKE